MGEADIRTVWAKRRVTAQLTYIDPLQRLGSMVETKDETSSNGLYVVFVYHSKTPTEVFRQ